MNKKLITGLLLIIFATLCFYKAGTLAEENNGLGLKIISAEQASALIEENKSNTEFVILDVRTSGEYARGHISNAKNIDYKSSDFKDNVGALDKDKTYITYCRSGRRSTEASEAMIEMGFENIYMIDGGIAAWDKAGLPTEN